LLDPRAARNTLVVVSIAIVTSVLSGTMTTIALPMEKGSPGFAVVDAIFGEH
jgi:ABC-type spermidine/putrescine transport system permease subunit II